MTTFALKSTVKKIWAWCKRNWKFLVGLTIPLIICLLARRKFNYKEISDRIKEDYEFYLNEYQKRLLTGQRSSKSSVVSSTTLSPNGTLCIRSDAIMITKDFFREVSKHYDK